MRSYLLYLPAATKLGQGNVFTGVCDSVHGGGMSLPQCILGYTPAGADPPGADPLPPRSRHPPGADTPGPLGADTPGSRHPSRSRLPPTGSRDPPTGSRPPHRKLTPAYDQRAAGTHHTGMHSCQYFFGPTSSFYGQKRLLHKLTINRVSL